MSFDMVMTGRVLRPEQGVSRKYSGHKQKPLPILGLSRARKALNYVSKAEMANSVSATVTAMIRGQFVDNKSSGHAAKTTCSDITTTCLVRM